METSSEIFGIIAQLTSSFILKLHLDRRGVHPLSVPSHQDRLGTGSIRVEN